MAAADQRIEDEPVEGRDDRRRRRSADVFSCRSDEPLSGSNEWRAERGIASGHKEQFVARERQGSTWSEPVLDRVRGAALGRCALTLCEVVKERGHHCWPVAKVVAYRAVWQRGRVFGGAHGETGGTGSAEDLQRCVEEPGTRRLLQAEKNTWYRLLHVENRV